MSVTNASQARVWKLGADVDTDALAPGHAMKHGIEVIAKYCLESLRPDFAGGVRRGDVIVAGPNFGIGSSREQAASVRCQCHVVRTSCVQRPLPKQFSGHHVERGDVAKIAA